MPSARADAERRSKYRVQPTSTDQLEIDVVAKGNHIAIDEIIDITINGASVRILDDQPASLSAGEKVTLNVKSPELAQRTDIEATVISHEERDGAQHCRLTFDQTEDILHRASREFFRLFNRRTAYRGIKPSEDDRVEFEIGLPDHGNAYQRVRLNNLSSTGACITVDGSLDDLLKLYEQITVRLQLPDNPRSIELPAELRNRHEKDGGILYGLQFDWTLADDPLGEAEEVLEYVLTKFEDQTSGPTLH